MTEGVGYARDLWSEAPMLSSVGQEIGNGTRSSATHSIVSMTVRQRGQDGCVRRHVGHRLVSSVTRCCEGRSRLKTRRG